MSYNVDSVKGEAIEDDRGNEYVLSDVFKFYGSGDVVGNACNHLQDGSPLHCAVACACNNEKGWYSEMKPGTDPNSYATASTDLFAHFMGDSGDNGAGLTSAIGPQIIDGRSTSMTLASAPMTPITTKTTASLNRGLSATTQTTATCYKQLCPEEDGWYTSMPNTSYFLVESSVFSGQTCHRIKDCHLSAGVYYASSVPNRDFFEVTEETGPRYNSETGKIVPLICARADKCNTARGYYSYAPSASWFTRQSAKNDRISPNLTCWKATGCQSGFIDKSNPANSYYQPNTSTGDAYAVGTVNEHQCYEQPIIEFGIALEECAYYPSENNAISYNDYADRHCNYGVGTCSEYCLLTARSGKIYYYNDTHNLESISVRGEGKLYLPITPGSPWTNDTEFIYFDAGSEIFGAGRTGDKNQNMFLIRKDTFNSTFKDYYFYDKSGELIASPSTFDPTLKTIVSSQEVSTFGSYFKPILRFTQHIVCPDGCNDTAPNGNYFTWYTTSPTAGEGVCYCTSGCKVPTATETQLTAYFSTFNSEISGTYSGSTLNGYICYKGTRCAGGGAYSANPNTNFFNYHKETQDTTCYRTSSCATGAYATSPNTSFFVTTSKTSPDGRTCYRATGCRHTNIDEDIFNVTSSKASGSTCYRATSCINENGWYYVSTVNADYFAGSEAKQGGLSCKHLECRFDEINSDTRPYFEVSDKTIIDEITGASMTCSVASGCSGDAEAYVVQAVGNEECDELIRNGEGVTGTRPDGYSFTCYTTKCPDDYYYSLPYNVMDAMEYCRDWSQVTTDKLMGRCHKSGDQHLTYERCYKAVCDNSKGYFSSSTSVDANYFTRKSGCSKPTCYFATTCASGASTSSPNTIYFNVEEKSIRKGGTTSSTLRCHRATSCNTTNGYYSSSSSISSTYFTTSYTSSGSVGCYYATGCKESNGYTSTANGSVVAQSGSVKCYKKETYFPLTMEVEVGIYDTGMNGSTHKGRPFLYRRRLFNSAGEDVTNDYEWPDVDYELSKIAVNTNSYAGLDCRAQINPGDIEYPTDGEFDCEVSIENHVTSGDKVTSCTIASIYTPSSFTHKATGTSASGMGTGSGYAINKVNCYGADAGATPPSCPDGYYSSQPNTNYFTTTSSGGCYKATGCRSPYIGYSSSTNGSYFITSSGNVSCYSHCPSGYYTSVLSYFTYTTTTIPGTVGQSLTCYKPSSCNGSYGYYSSASSVPSDYFNQKSLYDSGINCYYATACASAAYTFSPNTEYFSVSNKSIRKAGTTSTALSCYRATGCAAGVDSCDPFSNPLNCSGSNCSRASGYVCCKNPQPITCPGSGYYSTSGMHVSDVFKYSQDLDNPNCYYATCNEENGYFSSPSTLSDWFSTSTVTDRYTNVTCYYASGCNSSSYPSKPSTSYFSVTEYSTKSGSTTIRCYRQTCGTTKGYYSSVNSTYFTTGSVKDSYTNLTCYYAKGCATGAYSTSPSTTYFTTAKSAASGKTCYRANGCAIGAYLISPSTTYFYTAHSSASSFKCYRATSCRSGYSSTGTGEEGDTKSGIKCYKNEATFSCPTSIQVTLGIKTSGANTLDYYITPEISNPILWPRISIPATGNVFSGSISVTANFYAYKSLTNSAGCVETTMCSPLGDEWVPTNFGSVKGGFGGLYASSSNNPLQAGGSTCCKVSYIVPKEITSTSGKITLEVGAINKTCIISNVTCANCGGTTSGGGTILPGDGGGTIVRPSLPSIDPDLGVQIPLDP